MKNAELSLLLMMIDQAFDHKSWHGTNLKGSIKGMKAGDAARRPSLERHNVWEIVLHAAYWKYVVRRRLLSEARGSFPIKGSNWFKRPLEGADLSEAEWKRDVALLIETHKTLRQAVAQLTEEQIHHTPSDSKVSNLELIMGIASHDLYHAGQIQLLKRLGRMK